MHAWIWKWDDGPGRGDFRFVMGCLARDRPGPAMPLAEFDADAAAGALGEFFRARQPGARRPTPVRRERMGTPGYPWLRVGPFGQGLTPGLTELLRARGLTGADPVTQRPLNQDLCKRFYLNTENEGLSFDPDFGDVVRHVEGLGQAPGASDWLTLGEGRDSTYVQTAVADGGFIVEWGCCPPPDYEVTLGRAGRREPAGAVLRARPSGAFATFENEVLTLAETLAVFRVFYERRPRPEEGLVWRDMVGDLGRE